MGDINERACWVCFMTDEDENGAKWLTPCRCRGSTRWVHERCLQRWIDEKQKGDINAKVFCTQCAQEYIIVYPTFNLMVSLLDRVDRIIAKISPLITGAVILGSVYWVSVTYGAITVFQVMGYEQGMSLMTRSDPAVLLLGLPTIPVLLVLGKMVPLEERLLRAIQPPPAPRPQEQVERRENANATRILCGALAFPTIAVLTGKYLFSSVPGITPTKRALLGGLTFFAVRGLLNVYYKRSTFIRKSKRRILDYTDPGGPHQI